MKKLVLMGMILALGTTAMAENIGDNSSNYVGTIESVNGQGTVHITNTDGEKVVVNQSDVRTVGYDGVVVYDGNVYKVDENGSINTVDLPEWGLEQGGDAGQPIIPNEPILPPTDGDDQGGSDQDNDGEGTTPPAISRPENPIFDGPIAPNDPIENPIEGGDENDQDGGQGDKPTNPARPPKPSNPIEGDDTVDNERDPERVEAIRQQVSSNKQDIGNMNQRINETRGQMKEIGAQSASLTASSVMATQNLEVGEIGIGVGHGSYSDASAQSFSVGVRATENLSMTAGWSYGDDYSDMWNAGMGYKFKGFSN